MVKIFNHILCSSILSSIGALAAPIEHLREGLALTDKYNTRIFELVSSLPDMCGLAEYEELAAKELAYLQNLKERIIQSHRRYQAERNSSFVYPTKDVSEQRYREMLLLSMIFQKIERTHFSFEKAISILPFILTSFPNESMKNEDSHTRAAQLWTEMRTDLEELRLLLSTIEDPESATNAYLSIQQKVEHYNKCMRIYQMYAWTDSIGVHEIEMTMKQELPHLLDGVAKEILRLESNSFFGDISLKETLTPIK